MNSAPAPPKQSNDDSNEQIPNDDSIPNEQIPNDDSNEQIPNDESIPSVLIPEQSPGFEERNSQNSTGSGEESPLFVKYFNH